MEVSPFYETDHIKQPSLSLVHSYHLTPAFYNEICQDLHVKRKISAHTATFQFEHYHLQRYSCICKVPVLGCPGSLQQSQTKNYQLCQSVSANYNSKFKQLCLNKILLSKGSAEDSWFLPTHIHAYTYIPYIFPSSGKAQ